MTWELPKITSGLFPYPQTTTGVAYILGLVGTNSQRDETITQSHTETVTAFAGGLLEMTATATGSRGPTYSNITASFEGKYTKTGLFTDDGALNTSFRVDYAADNSTTVNSNGLWTGTNLLYDGDRGRTSYTFQKPASGPGQWNADFTYDASNIGMPGSTLGLRGYAAGNGTGFSAMRGEGHVDLEAPFFGGNLSVKSHGLYSNGLFKAVADVSTSLVNVAVADDRLTTTVHTEAGTALASPTATLTMSYTGLHVFAANDKVRVRLGVGTRRGVDTGFELGGDYSLSEVGHNTTMTLDLKANDLGLPAVPSVWVYHTSDLFGTVGVGVRGDQSTQFFWGFTY